MPRRSVLLSAVVALATAPLGAQAIPTGPRATGWEFTGDARATSDGLQMRNGAARYPATRLRDGTIDFDMQVTSFRTFVYLDFRMQSAEEHEEIYFRPHKTRLPDAIQYSPVWNGISNWQLYHGPGGTAAIGLPPGTWIHVRLVLAGSHAALYVGDRSTPALLMNLARDPIAGFLGFRSFAVDDELPTTTAAMTVRNVVVTPASTPPEIPVLDPQPVPDGLVTQWAISEAFASDSNPARTVPTVTSWTTLPSDARGLLVISRDVAPLKGTTWSAVLARVTVTADRDRLVPLQLGWSDVATVFLNGKPIFSRDDSYRFDRPRRDGLIGLDQGTIFLPLRTGRNDLVVQVADRFGGWGIMGRFPERDGLAISTGP